jgi:hypothetical protein
MAYCRAHYIDRRKDFVVLDVVRQIRRAAHLELIAVWNGKKSDGLHKIRNCLLLRLKTKTG